MSGEKSTERTEFIGRAITYGLLTAAFYLAGWLNTDVVGANLTMATWYVALPFLAIAVSLPLAFAINLRAAWPVAGSVQRAAQRQTEKTGVVQRKHSVYRARARAHINPWHNF